MKKKWIITAAIIAAFCLAGVGYNYYKKGKSDVEEVKSAAPAAAKKNVLNVNGLVINHQSLTEDITMVGNLLPDEEVDLTFETSGKIIEINFNEGTRVKKGDLLAKVNDRPLQAQLKRYEAQLKLA